MAFFKPEYWSGLSFPSPGDLPDPGLLHCRQTPYRLSYQGSSLSYNIYSFHKFHLNLPLSIFFFTKIMVVTNYKLLNTDFTCTHVIHITYNTYHKTVKSENYSEIHEFFLRFVYSILVFICFILTFTITVLAQRLSCPVACGIFLD